MRYARLKSLVFGLSIASLVLILGTFFVPPILEAHAEAEATAPPVDGGLVAKALGVGWDFTARVGWSRAVPVLFVILLIAGINLGAGKLAVRYGWPRLGAFFESNDVRIGSVFLAAFLWSVVEAYAAGDVWSKPVLQSAVMTATSAVGGHQVWKQSLQKRVKRWFFSGDDAASSPEPSSHQ